MVFSSLTFLFLFLPIVILCYYIAPMKVKNYILLIFSFLFYTFGEPKYIILLLTSCVVNYIMARWISISHDKKRKILLIGAIIFNVCMIGYFKYIDFLLENINLIFHSNISLVRVALPIGISFYTFQCISYVVDVYRNKVQANHNLFAFATYISFFPQLIAGPIVRYVDINEQLKNRKHTFEKFSTGIERFIVGLAKKVILANMMGEFIIQLSSIESTFMGYWIVAIAYVFQVYFDFSGYSDMAIGLGKMFGFEFLENFRYPLIASTITDFWRRWHISLSSWFKDYVYIPLKGSRVKPVRLCINLLIVWSLTGLWHGAEWNFVIWGLYFAFLLMLEKLLLLPFFQKHHIIGHIYTFFSLCIGFTFFQYDISEWNEIFSHMFYVVKTPIFSYELLYYIKSYLVLFLICSIAATPFASLIHDKFKEMELYKLLEYIEMIGYVILFIISIAFLIDASFNPFLYFRF